VFLFLTDTLEAYILSLTIIIQNGMGIQLELMRGKNDQTNCPRSHQTAAGKSRLDTTGIGRSVRGINSHCRELGAGQNETIWPGSADTKKNN
jgi:hypothetical protein